jgi:hypothetical protein
MVALLISLLERYNAQMSLDLNNVSMLATAISGYLFVIITAGAWFRWWFKHHIKETLAELRPNHGSSVKDQVTRLEQRVDDIYKILCERN